MNFQHHFNADDNFYYTVSFRNEKGTLDFEFVLNEDKDFVFLIGQVGDKFIRSCVSKETILKIEQNFKTKTK